MEDTQKRPGSLSAPREKGVASVIELAGPTAFVIAALREFGAAAFAHAQDDAADATVGLGRRVLQRIFGTRAAGEPVPEQVADVAADPQDENAVAALRPAIRNALAPDPRLHADVEAMLASAGVSVGTDNMRLHQPARYR
jgi:hypothetical protein